MRCDIRLTITLFTYNLILEGKDEPADSLQKQAMWPRGNSLPPVPAGEMSVSMVCSDPGKLRRQLRH